MSFTKRVLQYFVGIDELREQKRQEVAKLNAESEKYNPGYIREYIKEAENDLIADRQERAKKAKEEIEAIRQELLAKVYKDPHDEAQANTPEHKLLVEMQQARKLDLLKAELEVAETADDFKNLLTEYGEYEHFYKLINLNIEKRIKNADVKDVARLQAIRNELNQEPKEIQELNKLSHTVTFLGNSNMHPVGLENGDFSNINFEKLI